LANSYRLIVARQKHRLRKNHHNRITVTQTIAAAIGLWCRKTSLRNVRTS